MKYRGWVAVAGFVAAVSTTSWAQSGSENVSPTVSIYLAGGNTYTIAPSFGGGVAPFMIALDPGIGRVLTLSATGTATFCPGGACGTSSPDGPSIGNTGLDVSGSISGIQAVSSGFLAAVFLAAALPASAPASLNFTNLNFLTLAPLLGQQFFVGDGKTSTNVTQQFFVPDDAQFLAFGIADGNAFFGNPDFYGDNAGNYAVTYAVSSTPEPSSVVLVVTGLAAAGMVRRRKREGPARQA